MAVPVALPEGLTPGKVIAVHLNYHSRAAQRGRTPTEPSYFFKPPRRSRPAGIWCARRGPSCLAYEGEIAVDHRPPGAQRDCPRRAGDHIGWFAPANDVGLHDIRWADRGSEPALQGPGRLHADRPGDRRAGDVDRGALRLTTTVNGELRPGHDRRGLIFAFGQLVADLSRFMTLERGDVILTGTPAGDGGGRARATWSRSTLEGAGSVSSRVVAGISELEPYGAMPKRRRRRGRSRPGSTRPRPAPLSADAAAMLEQVSTATLTVQLARRGVARHVPRRAAAQPARPAHGRLRAHAALRRDARGHPRGDARLRGRAEARRRVGVAR